MVPPQGNYPTLTEIPTTGFLNEFSVSLLELKSDFPKLFGKSLALNLHFTKGKFPVRARM